jgi:hypothetical protein
MRAHIVENGVVTNTIEVESLDFIPGLIDGSAGGIGWLWNGVALTPPPAPDVSPEEIKAAIVSAVQDRLDTWAQTHGYDSVISLCTYASSTVERFRAEGQNGVDKRDQTWAALIQIMSEVESGTRPMPAGYADIEADLPALDWIQA